VDERSAKREEMIPGCRR